MCWYNISQDDTCVSKLMSSLFLAHSLRLPHPLSLSLSFLLLLPQVVFLVV